MRGSDRLLSDCCSIAALDEGAALGAGCSASWTSGGSRSTDEGWDVVLFGAVGGNAVVLVNVVGKLERPGGLLVVVSDRILLVGGSITAGLWGEYDAYWYMRCRKLDLHFTSKTSTSTIYSIKVHT